MKKRVTNVFCTLLLAAVMLAGALPVSAAAKKPVIKSVKYEGKGKVEVDFAGRVQYGSSLKVTVTDSRGKVCKAAVVDKDQDDLEIRLSAPEEGMTYKFKITKIRSKGEKAWTTVSGKFTIAAAAQVLVEEVEYDAKDREVSFDFQGLVHWKNAKVKIVGPDGKNVVRKIDEKNSGEIEVKVSRLTSGKKYQYTISGIARKGSSKFRTVKGSFRV